MTAPYDVPPMPEPAERSTVIGGVTLSLPPGHRLPDLRAMMPTYDAHIGWIIAALGRTDPQGCMIDVGANVGDTAATLRAYAPNPLLCVEGNAEFAAYLHRNIARLTGEVAVIDAFVSVPEIAAACLQYRAGTGSGGFVDAPAPPPPQTMIDVADVVAHARARHGRIALFKTDTDGLDAFILRDVLRLPIGEAVLFFECDEAHTATAQGDAAWDDNFRVLRACGYSLIVYDNHGLPMLFAASEQLDTVDDLRFYLRRQYAADALRVHYLDMWAFPPAHRALFETLRAQRDELFF